MSLKPGIMALKLIYKYAVYNEDKGLKEYFTPLVLYCTFGII
jgi:hypothetical protein